MSDSESELTDNCYCHGPRELGTVELLCGRCSRWFHKRCLSLKNLKCIPFIVNYTFLCRNCNEVETESFIPRQSNFTQMCITALANLTCAQPTHMHKGKAVFSKDKDIIPYIDAHWEGLTSMSRRVKQTWHQTVVKTMAKEKNLFSKVTVLDPSAFAGRDYYFGLVEQDLTKIGPAYDLASNSSNSSSVNTNSPNMSSSSSSSSHHKRSKHYHHQHQQQQIKESVNNQQQINNNFVNNNDDNSNINNNVVNNTNLNVESTLSASLCATLDLADYDEFNNGQNGNNSATDVFLPPALPKTRGAKRKYVSEQQNLMSCVKRTKSDTAICTKFLPTQGYPSEHPFNRDGYRYFLAVIDAHAPNRQEFDESNETAGKPIPSYMYRVYRHHTVLLSPHDRAQQLKLTDDRLQVTGEKGYSVVRATHGVSQGGWYYEVKFLDQPNESHARIGWSQSLGCLQAPVGYDKFSYSWRSRKGTFFHESNGKHYADGGYAQGDVLGFYIYLPENPKTFVLSPTYKDLPLIKFKNYFYYEEKDEVQKALKALKVLSGSKIICYKNGVNQGVAFTDMYDGTYYPAVSLYKNATVRVNFGPKFKYPPKDIKYRPYSERAETLIIEQTLADILFFIENEGKLSFDVCSV